MSIQDSRSLSRVKPLIKESESSPIREMMKMMEERSDLINLSAGEANFEAPTKLIELACQAMRSGRNRYTSTNGIPEIRHAIADFLEKSMQVKIDPDKNLLLTVGGMEAIYLATRLLIHPGDEVLLPDPGWGILSPIVSRLQAVRQFYPLSSEGGWSIEAGPILDRISEKTKLIVVNTPSNPTGAIIGREAFQAVIEAAERVGAFVLSDEVYHNYLYEGEHVSALSFGAPDNVIMVNSFSKTFAVTGWRLGFVAAHPWVIRQMAVYKETISLCSYSIGQWALKDYLPECSEYLKHARDLCRNNMEKIVARLSAHSGVKCPIPSGGIYVFPDFSEFEPSADNLFKSMLDGGVALVPGPFFGQQGAGHARIMFAASPEIVDQALDRMDNVLEKG